LSQNPGFPIVKRAVDVKLSKIVEDAPPCRLPSLLQREEVTVKVQVTAGVVGEMEARESSDKGCTSKPQYLGSDVTEW